MRYVMKQKLFSLGDDFVVNDENGNNVFLVKSKAFSLNTQLLFQNMDQQELACIRKKFLTWGPTYEIYKHDDLWAVVHKEAFTFFKCRFEVEVPGIETLEASGDFLDHEYEFSRAGTPVAHVSKQWFTWSDTYGVDIDDKEDVLILASTVVIDMCCHADKD